MKTRHLVDQDGNHHIVAIDGLRVWIYRDAEMWVAHGIDIDYAVSGPTPEAVRRNFAMGLCMTVVENLRRFGSVQRFLSRGAPDEIRQRWLHALKTERIQQDAAEFRVPDDELNGLPRPNGLPPSVCYYQSGVH